MTNKSEETPDEVLILRRDLDNMRRSRDYFREERDNLKKIHEQIMEKMNERVTGMEHRVESTSANLDAICNEVTFLRNECDEAEREVTFYKTVAWVLAFFGAGLFALIIRQAL
jgi:hypothetical protein